MLESFSLSFYQFFSLSFLHSYKLYIPLFDWNVREKKNVFFFLTKITCGIWKPFKRKINRKQQQHKSFRTLYFYSGKKKYYFRFLLYRDSFCGCWHFSSVYFFSFRFDYNEVKERAEKSRIRWRKRENKRKKNM